MKKPKSNWTADNDKEYRDQVKRAQYVINSGYFKENFDLDIVSARISENIIVQLLSIMRKFQDV